jgi:hypothetical protein
MALCSLIEDYGLVGFETLAVEVRIIIWRHTTTIIHIISGQALNAQPHARY